MGVWGTAGRARHSQDKTAVRLRENAFNTIHGSHGRLGDAWRRMPPLKAATSRELAGLEAGAGDRDPTHRLSPHSYSILFCDSRLPTLPPPALNLLEIKVTA